MLEELLLSDVHLHPYELLAYEGAFGTLFMLCVCLPLAMLIPGGNAPLPCPFPRLRRMAGQSRRKALGTDGASRQSLSSEASFVFSRLTLLLATSVAHVKGP